MSKILPFRFTIERNDPSSRLVPRCLHLKTWTPVFVSVQIIRICTRHCHPSTERNVRLCVTQSLDNRHVKWPNGRRKADVFNGDCIKKTRMGTIDPPGPGRIVGVFECNNF